MNMNARNSMTLLGLVLWALAGRGLAATVPDDVQDHVRHRVDEGGTMGIVVGVLDREGHPAFFCHGVTAKGGDKLDQDSVFEIGSFTKVFTSLLLVDAVRRGEMQLDDPISKYLPAKVKVPVRDDTPITLAHLASHRSGLPRMPDNFVPSNDANPYADYTVAQLYEFLGEYELRAKPGTKCEYSNVGAGLLGHILALKAGKSYDELVRERICGPLGMKQTACKLTPEMQKHLAQGHAAGEPTANWDLDALAGAGALRSTPRDMALFLAACLGQGGEALQPLLKATLEPRFPTGKADMDVALGWHINKKFGGEIIWHNGGTGGYHSFGGFRPDRGLAVLVLTNCDDDIDDIGLHVLAPESALKPVRTVVALPTATLDEYVGYFAFAPELVLHVTRIGGSLRAQLTGQEMFPLFAEAKDKFYYKVVPAQITFERGDDGQVGAVLLHQNNRDQRATRLPKEEEPKERAEVPVAPDVLKAYVGKYQLALGGAFDVRVINGRLSAQLTGQPRFPLYAGSETEFFYKVVEAQITFTRGTDGAVESLTLHQGGRDQTAKRQ